MSKHMHACMQAGVRAYYAPHTHCHIHITHPGAHTHTHAHKHTRAQACTGTDARTRTRPHADSHTRKHARAHEHSRMQTSRSTPMHTHAHKRNAHARTQTQRACTRMHNTHACAHAYMRTHIHVERHPSKNSFRIFFHSTARSFATCHKGHMSSRTPNVPCPVAPSG